MHFTDYITCQFGYWTCFNWTWMFTVHVERTLCII